MFKVWHQLTPVIFMSLFTHNSDIHSHNTRQNLNFRVPFARTEYMKRAISIKGASLWNKYCNLLSIDCSFVSFKISLKRHLVNDSFVNP